MIEKIGNRSEQKSREQTTGIDRQCKCVCVSLSLSLCLCVLCGVTVRVGALAVRLLHQLAHAAATGCLGLASGKAVARVCSARPMWSKLSRSCCSVRPYIAAPRLHCPVSERSHRQPCPAGARGTDAKRNLVKISTPLPRSIFCLCMCCSVRLFAHAGITAPTFLPCYCHCWGWGGGGEGGG